MARVGKYEAAYLEVQNVYYELIALTFEARRQGNTVQVDIYDKMRIQLENAREFMRSQSTVVDYPVQVFGEDEVTQS